MDINNRNDSQQVNNFSQEVDMFGDDSFPINDTSTYEGQQPAIQPLQSQQDYSQQSAPYAGQHEMPVDWSAPQGTDFAEFQDTASGAKSKVIRVIGITLAVALVAAVALFIILYYTAPGEELNSFDAVPNYSDGQQDAPDDALDDISAGTGQGEAATLTNNNGWTLIGNTDGFSFVETREAIFVVQGLNIYTKQSEGGIQIRHTAFGVVQGFGGVYEVDIPRSAALISEVAPGFTFKIFFDIYRSADGQISFLENLRPN